MKFCKNCGNVLIIVNNDTEKFLFCRKCNLKYPADEEVVFATKVDKEKKIIVCDSDESIFPTTNVLCPKCQTMEKAEWTLIQTRAADEPPTKFYRCKKCSWVWREYS
jgi:DNA-directed RNA polymerase subunit M